MVTNEVHYLEKGWENLFETRKIMGTSNRKKYIFCTKAIKRVTLLLLG